MLQLKVFFWLVFPLYRMVMMQRKLPRINSKGGMTPFIIVEGQQQAPGDIPCIPEWGKESPSKD